MIAAVVPVDAVAVLAYAADLRPSLLFARAGTDDFARNITVSYLPGLYRLDPFYHLFRNGARAGCYRLSEIAPDRFSREEYYEAFYRHTGSVDEFVVATYPHPDLSIHVCLVRNHASAKRFGRSEREDIVRVAPIVMALVDANWRDLSIRSNRREAAITLKSRIRDVLEVEITDRQEQVAILVLKGYSTAAIAAELRLSPNTIKVFRKQLFRRLGISSQGALFGLLLPLYKMT